MLRLGAPVTALSLSPAMDLLATAHVGRRGLYLWANSLVYGRGAEAVPSEAPLDARLPALAAGALLCIAGSLREWGCVFGPRLTIRRVMTLSLCHSCNDKRRPCAYLGRWRQVCAQQRAGQCSPARLSVRSHLVSVCSYITSEEVQALYADKECLKECLPCILYIRGVRKCVYQETCHLC